LALFGAWLLLNAGLEKYSWTELPEAIKAGILAMVKAATH
jgi:hypothetical protein